MKYLIPIFSLILGCYSITKNETSIIKNEDIKCTSKTCEELQSCSKEIDDGCGNIIDCNICLKPYQNCGKEYVLDPANYPEFYFKDIEPGVCGSGCVSFSGFENHYDMYCNNLYIGKKFFACYEAGNQPPNESCQPAMLITGEDNYWCCDYI